MIVTHFFHFADEAAARAALPSYWAGDDWRRDCVDGPVPIVDANGALVPGYFINIGLPELHASMPGLTGAGYGQADHFTLVYGTAPDTPQRVFAV